MNSSTTTAVEPLHESPLDSELPVPPAETPGPASTCPKCRWRLIDPAVMGYCPKCGYCRYLQTQKQSAAPLNPRRESTSWLRIRTMIGAVAAVPGWLSILLVGSFAVLLYVQALDHLLPPAAPQRVNLGLGLLFAATIVLALSHFWALVKVAPDDYEFDVWDLLSPAQIWGSALRQLPATRWPIWLACWSLALIAGSIFFLRV
jgi:hypothetical protein